MKELIIAIGLLLFIEGMLYALFPSKMKNMLNVIENIASQSAEDKWSVIRCDWFCNCLV